MRRTSSSAKLVALALTVVASACGQSPSGSDHACVPGASVACAGAGGCSGYQVCNAAGSAYEPCSCPDLDGAVEDASTRDATTNDATTGEASTDAQGDATIDAWSVGDGGDSGKGPEAGDGGAADSGQEAATHWDGGPVSATVTGAVQKGPFSQGTTITVQELDASLNPTGTVFLTSTTDNLGSFSLNVSLSSPYIEIIASGYYFDEVAGSLSASQLTLHALAEVTSSTAIYVNLLTDLAVGRITSLVTGGQTFASAVSQAEGEILSALSLPATGTDFTGMSITQPGTANADLLAASVLLDQDAWHIAPTAAVAELTALQSQIGSQIATTGTLNKWAPLVQLRCGMAALANVNAVTANLTNYYGQFTDGGGVNLPDFAPVLAAPAWCEGTTCGGGSGQTWCSNACSSSQADPCCVNEQTDTSHCGTCGNACAVGASCVSGTCVCPNGGTPCGGICKNEQIDTQNCGGCGVVCPESAPACWGACTTAGSCAPGGAGMTNCGSASESCCTSLSVPGGTYDQTYTNTGSGPTGASAQVTVSAFRLDKYEVTVGRFRQFVAAWNNGYLPAVGSGKHTHLNGGQGLNVTDGFESGWATAFDASVKPNDAALASCAPYSTWTSAPAAQENLPINCITVTVRPPAS